jgi:hypothetical protein
MPVYQSPQSALREVAHRLGLAVPSGRFLRLRCPVHHSDQDSLSLWVSQDGWLRAKCFAGCSQVAILAALGCTPGTMVSGPSDAAIEAEIVSAKEAAEKTQLAQSIWDAVVSVTAESLAAYYFREVRRITLPSIPGCLRETASLWHSASRSYRPALVARVDDEYGEFTAVHRTWLDPTTGNKAPVDPPRMMLGPQQHGAVRLFKHPSSSELLVAEGIETALAAGELDRWQRSVWAAISTSGLMALHVPREFSAVVIAADHDRNGAGERAANILAHRLRKKSVHAQVIAPPEPDTDWADVVLAQKRGETS